MVFGGFSRTGWRGGCSWEGALLRSFFLGNHNIITVKTAQYLLFRCFYRQGIQIKVIGVDYTHGILFTGLGDGGLSVGGHFQYVFPNTEGGVLNDMIAAEVHKNLFHLTFLLNTNFPQSIMF